MGCILEVFVSSRKFSWWLEILSAWWMHMWLCCEYWILDMMVRPTTTHYSLRNNQLHGRRIGTNILYCYQSLIGRQLFQEGDTSILPIEPTLCGWSTSEEEVGSNAWKSESSIIIPSLPARSLVTHDIMLLLLLLLMLSSSSTSRIARKKCDGPPPPLSSAHDNNILLRC